MYYQCMMVLIVVSNALVKVSTIIFFKILNVLMYLFVREHGNDYGLDETNDLNDNVVI